MSTLDPKTSSPASQPRRLHRVRLALAALCALVVVATAASAAASTVLKLDMESLVANSEQIADATVTRVQSKVEDGKVYTYTTIAVEEGLKGVDDGETLTIKQLGGRTEDLATWVPGVPNFEAGERVVVFLEKPAADAMPVVTGMAQGKFHIALGPDNATPFVVPYLGDLALITPRAPADLPSAPAQQTLEVPSDDQAKFQPAQPADLYQRAVPLDVFKQQVREVIRGQGD